MKILHTSDWHFGHQLYGYDRREEHFDFAMQLVDIVQRERPDALVISGDVFDIGSPSVAVQQLYAETLMNLHRVAPDMPIVVTAGNHDSPSRLEVYRDVWDAHNVHIIGTLGRSGDDVDWQRHFITIPGKGIIVALPHIYAQNYPATDMPDRVSAFYTKLQVKVEEINVNNLPIILMAHAAVRGCDLTGHRRMQEDSIGNIEYIDLETFGSVFDYIALGHIHHAQTLKGLPITRYSGSPVAVGFDENYTHSVSIVNVEHGKTPEIETVEIKTIRPLVTLPQKPVPFDEAVDKLAAYPDDEEAYIRLNVLSDNGLPADYNERIALATANKKCKFCTVNVTRETPLGLNSMTGSMTPDEFRQLKVTDVAQQFMSSKNVDNELGEKYLRMISDIEKSISHED